MSNRAARLKLEEKVSQGEAVYQRVLSEAVSKAAQAKTSVPALIERTLQDISHFTLVYPPVKELDTLRPLKSQNPGKIRLTIAQHLYGKYKIPACLQSAWLIETGDKRFLETIREWFICAGTGGSLYKQYFKGILTKQEVHALSTCTCTADIHEALIYALAIQHKNGKIAQRLMHTKLPRRRTGLELITQKKHVPGPGVGSSIIVPNEATHEMVDFFCRHPELTVPKINDLIDFFEHSYRQPEKFTLYGRTLESVKRKSIEWHRTQVKYAGPYREWEGFRLHNVLYNNENYDPKSYDEWTFTQLLNSNVLTDEGVKQRHCVAGYTGSCVSGSISIWSLKLNGKRALTIEMTRDHTIVQARGLANRNARPEEVKVLKRWAMDQGLSIGKYVL